MSMPRPSWVLPLAFAVMVTPAGAQPADPSFRLTNRTARAIAEIYVASSGVNSWGTDRLGDKTLGSGANTTIRLPAGQCVNDVRVVFDNGEATERRRVNTCSQGDLVFP
ncbi:MAG: hypothetical protein JWP04_434 [Belnapia sp.]|nr:hypothetical protein [Belnapia sp.]